MDNCYGCGKSGDTRRDCPLLRAQGRENNQAQARITRITSDM